MKKSILQKNKDEIYWNLINAFLAGALVFLGSLASAEAFTWRGLIVAVVASLIVICSKFKDYWDKEKKEYSRNYLFTFV